MYISSKLYHVQWLLQAFTPSRPSHAVIPSGVPSFVVDYAPIVYLHSSDPYQPSDIQAQLSNTRPKLQFTGIPDAPDPLNLDNIEMLNRLGGSRICLTALDDVSAVPEPNWMLGVHPDATGRTDGATSAVVIVNDHGGGDVDAFYFYFYAFNWGGYVLDRLQVGNHVGDWEHNMIRFKDGKPTYVWFSQHINGQAFDYTILKKEGLRPVVFSANGSHANYAIPGVHDHTIPDWNLPGGLLEDFTDWGVRWDPTLSTFWYDYDAATFAYSPYESKNPTGFLKFLGHWGDEQYPSSDPRQRDYFGITKFGTGPYGPYDKQLNRSNICPDNGIACILRNKLGP